jgi:hypothetical protein
MSPYFLGRSSPAIHPRLYLKAPMLSHVAFDGFNTARLGNRFNAQLRRVRNMQDIVKQCICLRLSRARVLGREVWISHLQTQRKSASL